MASESPLIYTTAAAAAAVALSGVSSHRETIHAAASLSLSLSLSLVDVTVLCSLHDLVLERTCNLHCRVTQCGGVTDASAGRTLSAYRRSKHRNSRPCHT